MSSARSRKKADIVERIMIDVCTTIKTGV